ncbi:MAG: pilus assembly protein [Alphaproteobacteria bacterium]|nr:pilus assembly protein [Alphaproteobacteria bacterium]
MAMRTTLKPLAIFRRIGRNQEGLAYLEFALVMPLLMLLFLGGLELSRYIQVSQKVDRVTHTIVDLVAQAPTISESELAQIMQAVQHVMDPYEFSDGGKIIISCVGYNDQGNLVVKWQYAGGGELERGSRIGDVNNAPVLPEGFLVEARDNVIIAEAFFSFEPMINEQFVSPIEFYRTAFYLPRIGELDVLLPN